MAVSVIPFVIVQFPNMLSSDSGKNWAVLIGLIVSVILLISYCLYQVIGYLAECASITFLYHIVSLYNKIILGFSGFSALGAKEATRFHQA